MDGSRRSNSNEGQLIESKYITEESSPEGERELQDDSHDSNTLRRFESQATKTECFQSDGVLDDNAIDRLLHLDEGIISEIIPPSNPSCTHHSNVEESIPTFSEEDVHDDEEVGDCDENFEDDDDLEGSASFMSNLELPQACINFKDAASAQEDALSETISNTNQGNDERKGGISHQMPRVRLSDVLKDPEILNRLNPQEIFNLIWVSEGNIYTNLRKLWEEYQPNVLRTAERAQYLVEARGVKMERRPRVKPGVSAIEKKQIRAQRNRERSQALRRYTKKRLAELHKAKVDIRKCNIILKMFINLFLEDEKAYAKLNQFFASDRCSTELMAFLDCNK